MREAVYFKFEVGKTKDTGVRILGKEIEVSRMPVFDRKHGLQMSILSSDRWTPYNGILKGRRRNLFNFSMLRWLKTVPWDAVTTLYHLMLQSWYQNTAQLLVNTLLSFHNIIDYHSNSMIC